jgi:hypothetical protein
MAKKTKIDDLRDHLFAALEGLADEEKPMDIARAQAIADVAKVIVESAKVEVSYLKVTGALEGSGFIPSGEAEAPARPKVLQAAKVS